MVQCWLQPGCIQRPFCGVHNKNLLINKQACTACKPSRQPDGLSQTHTSAPRHILELSKATCTSRVKPAHQPPMTALHSHPRVEEGPAPELAWVATRYALPDVHQRDAICTCSLPSLANHRTYAYNGCCKKAAAVSVSHYCTTSGTLCWTVDVCYHQQVLHTTPAASIILVAAPWGCHAVCGGSGFLASLMLLGTLYSFRTLRLVLYNCLLLHAMQQPLAL